MCVVVSAEEENSQSFPGIFNLLLDLLQFQLLVEAAGRDTAVSQQLPNSPLEIREEKARLSGAEEETEEKKEKEVMESEVLSCASLNHLNKKMDFSSSQGGRESLFANCCSLTLRQTLSFSLTLPLS